MRLMFTLGRDQETFNYHFCTEFRGDSWQSAALGTCFELKWKLLHGEVWQRQ